MTEETRRAMIRPAIARHQGALRADDPPVARPIPFAAHASHFRYALTESGGPCLIESAVPCNHCGYCQSHGY